MYTLYYVCLFVLVNAYLFFSLSIITLLRSSHLSWMWLVAPIHFALSSVELSEVYSMALIWCVKLYGNKCFLVILDWILNMFLIWSHCVCRLFACDLSVLKTLWPIQLLNLWVFERVWNCKRQRVDFERATLTPFRAMN